MITRERYLLCRCSREEMIIGHDLALTEGSWRTCSRIHEEKRKKKKEKKIGADSRLILMAMESRGPRQVRPKQGTSSEHEALGLVGTRVVIGNGSEFPRVLLPPFFSPALSLLIYLFFFFFLSPLFLSLSQIWPQQRTQTSLRLHRLI